MIKGRQKEEADRENDREEVSKNIFRKAMFRERFGPLFGLGGWLSCFWAVCALPLQAQRYVEVSAEIQSYTYKNGIIDRDTASTGQFMRVALPAQTTTMVGESMPS